MTIAVAIFAKNPYLSPVKTRLADDIGKEKAMQFYNLCLQATQETILELMDFSTEKITPYWALAEQESLLLPQWQCFNTLWTGDGDLGERLHQVYSSLLKQHDGVVIIGSDSPALPVEFLATTITLIKNNNSLVVIGPAKDGGFYLFAGSSSIEMPVWLDTPYSCEKTLQVLQQQLHFYKYPLFLLPVHFDIDTKSNLIELKNYWQDQTMLNSTQQLILQFIDEQII